MTRPPNNSKPKEKILLLHGIACTHQVWEPHVENLTRDFTVLAPDLRFHGLNRDLRRVPQKPPLFTMQEYAQDLVDRMEKQRYHPVWVVGHSMGARIGVAVSHLRPQWVNGLVLVDHPPFSSLPQIGGFRNQFRRFLEGLPESFSSPTHAESYFHKYCPDPSSCSILVSSLTKGPKGELVLNFDKTAILRTFHSLPDYPYADRLRVLGEQGKPVLILRGGQSRFWNREDWDRCRHDFGKYSSVQFLEFPQVGHALPFEAPDPFLEALRSFMMGSRVS